jgi:hypothetical protein
MSITAMAASQIEGQRMRYLLIALAMLLCPVTSANAQVSVGIGLPGINIGINVPAYPKLVLVPGYPVYYDPRANLNYFFYDGLYWVYQGDNWYASSWYNGPWQLTGPEYVPLFVLRVPVRYYRRPPAYFRGWRTDAPPRWGEHWGRDWEQRRAGWDRWDHRAAPRAAPLPVYQRQYSGDRYPHAEEQQHSIRSEKYRYQPREAVTQQHFQPEGNPHSSRAEPQPQAPGQQRTSTQQQHVQPNQQHQQQQPMQPPPQIQRPPTAPQDKGRENKAAPQDKGRENRNEEHGQDRK